MPTRLRVHMPRADITGIRVERVQDIDWMGAIAEGITDPRRAAYRTDPIHGPVAEYHLLWDSINAKRGHPWANNDWVWVVEFKRV
jgi:hypothetical protein